MTNAQLTSVGHVRLAALSFIGRVLGIRFHVEGLPFGAASDGREFRGFDARSESA